jgi:CrcB protein
MTHVLLVAAGGALGAAFRHLSGIAAMRLMGIGFPYGTLFVNVFGSLLMGIFISWLARRSGTSAELRLFVATGFLGGFTTFSAFSLDVANLVERSELSLALTYVLVSVVISIAAVFAGLWFGRAML